MSQQPLALPAGTVEQQIEGGSSLTRSRWTVAVFGAIFVVLFTVALVLLSQIPHLDSPDGTYANFYAGAPHSVLITVGLNLVPFAGIDFVYFIMAVRALLYAAAGRRSLTQEGLQLASGILFVGLLFCGTAAAGGVAFLLYLAHVPAPPVSVTRVLASVGYAMVFIFGVRFAGMFVIATTTLLRSGKLLPLWLSVLSYLLAAFFLFSTTTYPAALLAFPAWMLLVSLALVLLRGTRSARPSAAAPTTQPPTGGHPVAHQSKTVVIDGIPGPKPMKIVGNLRDVDQAHLIESTLALGREYGPIFRLRSPRGDRFIVSGADLVEEICDDRRFDKLISGGLAELRHDPENAGLFTADTANPLWSRAHNILMPSFSVQSMQGYLPQMLDLADQLMNKWERLNSEDEIDVAGDMTRLTLDTIALCGFGYRFNSFYRDTPHPFVAAMVRNLEEGQARSNLPSALVRLRRRQTRQAAADTAFMEGVVDELIQRRKAEGGEHNDLLQRMLEGVDRKTGERLPDVNVRAQCITFLVAGHETTSGLLSFAVYFLLKHPEVMARVQQEVDEVLGTDLAVAPTNSQLRQLTYLNQVLNESLRLWPTAPGYLRYPLEDTVLGGKYRLAKGSSITVFTPLLHRDPSVWGGDAEEFNPDHFAPGTQSRRKPSSFTPFGFGQRACIGRQFAMQEATLVLAMALQRFDLVDHRDYQLRLKTTLTIKPDHLTIQVRRRTGRTRSVDAPREAAIAAPANGAAAPVPQSNGAAPATAPTGGHGTPLLVTFGSNLGTAEGIATRLAQEGTNRGFAVTLCPLDDHAGRLPHEGAAIVVTSSYNGTPPDNASRFCSWLTDPSTPADAGAGLRYTVFGCGSTDWAATYQAVPALIDEQLQAHGAQRVQARGEGDVSQDFDAQYQQWYGGLWTRLAESLSLSEDEIRPAIETGPRLDISLVNRQTANPVIVSYQAGAGLVQANRELQHRDGPRPSSRSTKHVELTLPPGVTYETGDHLGVLPRNDVGLILRVLRHFRLDAGMYVEITPRSGTHTHLPVGQSAPLLGILACCVELQDVAGRADIESMARYTDDERQRAELNALAAGDEESRRRYQREILLPHLSLIDLLERFPACAMPFQVYLDRLPPLRPRYYSISSSPAVSPESVSVSVGVLDAPRAGGGTFTGICSNYLSRSEVGSTVFSFVRKPSIPFRPPANPHRPMIMVGCGTGLAPFRGFLQDRGHQKQDGVPVGPSLLFFGCRDPEQDFIYQEELEHFQELGVAELVVAGSRIPGQPKRYVQHFIKDKAERVWSLLENDAVIYVCGDANKMAPDVRRAFMEVFSERNGKSEVDAEAWLAQLRADDRYLEDIWGGSTVPDVTKVAAGAAGR